MPVRGYRVVLVERQQTIGAAGALSSWLQPVLRQVGDLERSGASGGNVPRPRFAIASCPAATALHCVSCWPTLTVSRCKNCREMGESPNCELERGDLTPRRWLVHDGGVIPGYSEELDDEWRALADGATDWAIWQAGDPRAAGPWLP